MSSLVECEDLEIVRFSSEFVEKGIVSTDMLGKACTVSLQRMTELAAHREQKEYMRTVAPRQASTEGERSLKYESKAGLR